MPPPLLRPEAVVRAFERAGWTVVRRRASHIIMAKDGHPATLSIPHHPTVARGTLRSLVARSGLSMATFLTLVD